MRVERSIVRALDRCSANLGEDHGRCAWSTDQRAEEGDPSTAVNKRPEQVVFGPWNGGRATYSFLPGFSRMSSTVLPAPWAIRS